MVKIKIIVGRQVFPPADDPTLPDGVTVECEKELHEVTRDTFEIEIAQLIAGALEGIRRGAKEAFKRGQRT